MLPEHLVISPLSTSNQAVREDVNQLKEALDDAQRNLASAQEQMKRRVDKARRAKEWTLGDRVFLNKWNLWMFASHLPPKVKRCW